MRYADAAAFRQALEQRLKMLAEGDGARLSRERKRVVFGRLLARLSATAPDRWLLKGGFALDLRLPDRARATRDVDLDWRAGEAELLDALIDAAGHDAGDFFEFAVDRAGIPQDRLGGSFRFRVTASLAGRSFDAFPLDVGFREVSPRIDYLTTPDTLAFAGIAPVTVATIPLELQVAEKLHAYSRIYHGDRRSSRVKDLVDLVLIADLAPVDAALLRTSIDDTFAHRATHDMPARLPPPMVDWQAPFRQLAEAIGFPAGLSTAHAAAAALVDPILSEDIRDGTWEPERHSWHRVA